MHVNLMLQKALACLSKKPKTNTCFPQTWRPPQPRRLLGAAEEEGEQGAGIHKDFNSTGSSWLKASAMFLDVPGFLFTAAAGSLDRDKHKYQNFCLRNQRAADLQQKAKKQSGASSVNNRGTKLRDGSSCGSGTVQHHHVSATFLSLRRLHYSQVWIHLFPLECKMPQCDPCTVPYCHTHLFLL